MDIQSVNQLNDKYKGKQILMFNKYPAKIIEIDALGITIEWTDTIKGTGCVKGERYMYSHNFSDLGFRPL